MLPSLKARHQQFIRERQYLHNVSPATVRWYTHAFKWLSLCASPEDPSIVLPTFSAAQVKLLVTWKPKGFYERRLHLLVLILLDTGCRIGECLTVHVKDIASHRVKRMTLSEDEGRGRRQEKDLVLRRDEFL